MDQESKTLLSLSVCRKLKALILTGNGAKAPAASEKADLGVCWLGGSCHLETIRSARCR
jgi:hypothetical protein